MEISGQGAFMQPAAMQAEFSAGIAQKAQETSSALVNKLMNDSLSNTQDMARASNGIGTQLNVVA